MIHEWEIERRRVTWNDAMGEGAMWLEKDRCGRRRSDTAGEGAMQRWKERHGRRSGLAEQCGERRSNVIPASISSFYLLSAYQRDKGLPN